MNSCVHLEVIHHFWLLRTSLKIVVCLFVILNLEHRAVNTLDEVQPLSYSFNPQVIV